jgi:starch synthase
MYGLRFGTLPLVAYTGGLVDTVIDATPAGLRAGAATGVQFHPVTADALARALDRLCDLYANPDLWL